MTLTDPMVRVDPDGMVSVCGMEKWLKDRIAGKLEELAKEHS